MHAEYGIFVYTIWPLFSAAPHVRAVAIRMPVGTQLLGAAPVLALLWALPHTPPSNGQPSPAVLSQPPSSSALEALEALAELRDEPVMLNPSLSHHYKPPPPQRIVRALGRWEPRGGFLTPDEERVACAGFVGVILCIHLVGAVLGMPATTRSARMRVVAIAPAGSPQRDQWRQRAPVAARGLSLAKKRRPAGGAGPSASPSPSRTDPAAAAESNRGDDAHGWWWRAYTGWFDRVEWAARVLQVSLPPGPACITQRLLIDCGKGATLPVMLWLMWWTKNYSNAATLVTALHGSYGLLWCVKSQIFPDPQWDRQVTVLSAIVTCSWLVGYWGAGFFVIAGQLQLSPLRQAIAIMMYVFGVVLMMCADTQKYFMLSLRRGLVVEGWFRRCRNTNYLGEMLLYAAFAILAQSLLYWTFLLATWTHVFLINIYWKELSLMRKEGWEQYSRTSSLLLPAPAFSWRDLFPVVAVDDDHHEGDE